MDKQLQIAIVGLGYVGLPLAIAFAHQYSVVGYDINTKRVDELNTDFDLTKEADLEELHNLKLGGQLRFTSTIDETSSCNVFIVTVPTPVDEFKAPDLSPLLTATKAIALRIKKGDIVIYESTVYPGCTEEDCVPILEEYSGLRYNVDFYCGYSPERINPGDKVNTLTKIKKVTSGSTPEIAEYIDKLYASIITAGTHLAPSIKVAEAAKAIENAQRDINISFMNELALIFDRMDIDTTDVLAAASTKWNFLNFRPGLVGGHCIGVDPYYLTHKAEALGYIPEVILSGRRVNDNMGFFVANKCIKLLAAAKKAINGSKALVLGFTFKENCPDFRNTKVIDVVNELKSFSMEVHIHDPWIDPQRVQSEYNLTVNSDLKPDENYDLIILAVAHHQFRGLDFASYKAKGTIIFDAKSFIDREFIDARL